MAARDKMKSLHTGTSRGNRFSVKVRMRETGERFTVSGCSLHMRVADLKDKLELVAGVPINLQRLAYLDEGDMPDTSTLKFNGIIPGGTISMSVWPYEDWSDLIKAAAEGNIGKLTCLGVTEDSSYNTENSLCFSLSERRDWLASRSSVALYVASHRGHLKVIHFLLQNGANVLMKTPLGNSPLHVASAIGNCDCIDTLLANGAQTQDRNGKGHTALELAQLWSQKKVERRLFLFQWRERAATVNVSTHLDPSELFAHQKFDSKLKPWLCGSHSKRYLANLVPCKSLQAPDFHVSSKTDLKQNSSGE